MNVYKNDFSYYFNFKNSYNLNKKIWVIDLLNSNLLKLTLN